MIYSAGTGGISLNGSGNLTLSSPTSGTYSRITLFQERTSTKQISITAKDNMNLTGESFDYGPYRFLPRYDLGFVAAYFDHQGLYAYGRQPRAILVVAAIMRCRAVPR